MICKINSSPKVDDHLILIRFQLQFDLDATPKKKGICKNVYHFNVCNVSA